jgi:NAD(P)-dependent dehydrogenase (short-subunit alcohol dehydrogenase family)
VSWQLRDRVAVVTGASSGIGRATAVRLAREGMVVVAVARRGDRLDELAVATPGVHPYVADVTSTADVDGLAAAVEAEFGACHALVNDAGVPGGPFRDRDDLDDALRTIDVNLLGTIRCTASFAELLARSAPSRVVNVASVSGRIGVGPAAYCASKFGMVGLSEALSLSWADRGVTVCQLNPGFVETEGFRQEQVKRSPLAPLIAQPEVVAEAVVDVLASGRTERTVPRFYRAVVVLRHLAPPLYRRAITRVERSGGTRD